MLTRGLTDRLARSTKSVLLLGPRQTGKSTLLKSLRPDQSINLADEEQFVQFLRDPGLLRRRLGNSKTILIDEIQRIPSMLNTVQALLDEDKSRKFYLSGSSARKLRRGQANLLPGRIHTHRLGPLAPSEVVGQSDIAFDFGRVLTTGLLPEPFLAAHLPDGHQLLRSYATTYLREEIQAEALTRNLEGFARFFEVIASRSGDFIDFAKFTSQASIERSSGKRYFDTLCDTLVLEKVEAFTKSGKRRLIQHPRYYFFDVGVLNGTIGNFVASADRKGALVEHLFLQCALSEFRARNTDVRVSVYRTEAGAEVDFIFEIGSRVVAVEVKGSKNLGTNDLNGLKSFGSFYGKRCELLIAFLGEQGQNFGQIRALPFLSAVATLVGV